MQLHQRVIACLLTCSVLAATVGCTTMRTIVPVADPTVDAFTKIRRFDTVDVETRDGQRVRFVVGAVERDALISEDGVRYSRTDILQVHHKAPNGWGTVALVMVLMIPGVALQRGAIHALLLLLGASVVAAIGG